MSMPMKNVILSIIMLLFGVWFAYLSSELPDRTIPNVPGPAFFPGIVSIFVIVISLSLLVKGLKGLRALPAFTHDVSFPYKAVFIVFMFLVFLVLLPYAGFLLAGIPFFAGLMILCENRKPIHVLAGAIAIPVFLYFLFREAFTILLPAGQWM